MWDDEAWDAISARFVQVARDAGALSVLPLALTTRTGAHLFAGRLAVASSLVERAGGGANEATGASQAPYAALTLAAFQGREAEAAPLIETATDKLVRRGEEQGLTFIHWAIAVLGGTAGPAPLERWRERRSKPPRNRLRSGLQRGDWSNSSRRPSVDDAPRARPTRSAGFRRRTLTPGADWAPGIEARSRALLTEGEGAETLYRRAIEALARTGVRADWARGHLLYGESIAEHAADSTPAPSYAPPTSYSRSSAWKRSPTRPS